MISYILRRLLWAVPVLWIVATLTFFIMHLVPGGPFDREKKLPPEIKANVEAKYHLDQPIHRQYLLYLKGLIQGDLGPSYKYLGRTVNDVIGDTLPVSIQLGLLALGIAILFGLIAGMISSVTAHTLWDRISMFFATAGISTPNFVLGALLVYLLSHRYKIFPPALWEGLPHVVLPAITLGLAPAAYIARLTRSSILETNRQDYVRTARSKGLSEGAILFRHILKNAVSPVVTILGPLTAALVTGSFVVEFIFSIPGMGKFFITAVTNRDYPLIMGVTLIYAVLIVIANLLVDIFYTMIDPRVRLE
ncbi:MAG: ABC transporter permease [Candidatus Manganitrophaceae bacterium]|nr:MAG: ABC transporter permease [Candidatus Manganitrophaceae bacterium]